jgi:UDP:flavonoid glycosyltransferase YjiC (YdhE family)
MWLDLYNYAQMAEDIGVGVYATRGIAPEWSVARLRESFLRVVGGGQDSLRMKERAKELGELARKEPGRSVAAREIVRFTESECA